MNKYDKYFLMEPKDVPGYISYRLPDFFGTGAVLSCNEIGDGNLNYVFRVFDENSDKTLIVKQAAEELRISKEMKVSTDRGRIEADILKLQAKLAPGLVPEVYFYDEVMCVICMEDMTGHEMMRTALTEHKIFPKFAEQISEFLVNTLLKTSDIVMPHKEKELLVKKFVNPDLCEITHDLVYTEPYNDCRKRNIFMPANAEFIKQELYNDTELHLEVAKLKSSFLTNAQSLIHGDLHTGSVFINKDHIFVFDPEFAFYGPAGYDIGNIIANLFFAWLHSEATQTDEKNTNEFRQFILDTIKDTIDRFKEKFRIAYRENVNDIMFKSDEYMELFLSQILSDTAGVAGLETIRRTVGMAGVKDIRGIGDDAKRARAERILITLGKDYILRRSEFKNGKDYTDAILSAVSHFN